LLGVGYSFLLIYPSVFSEVLLLAPGVWHTLARSIADLAISAIILTVAITRLWTTITCFFPVFTQYTLETVLCYPSPFDDAPTS
jgi:hypothetical protein